jgi:hypothetical protein
MKISLLIVAMLIVGCSSSETNDQQCISRDQAIAIAKKANVMDYDQTQPVEIERVDDNYIVTFPLDMSAEPGTRYRGPDYAAKFWIDAKTGEITEALGGS